MCVSKYYVAEFVWISHDWAGIEVRLFGEAEVYEKLGREFSLLTLSHRGDLDWVAGYIVATQFNFIHVSVQSLHPVVCPR